MKCVLLVADDNCVARVISAIELNYVVNVLCQKVCGFAFTFVTPLGSDNHYCGHTRTSLYKGFVRDGVHLSLSA